MTADPGPFRPGARVGFLHAHPDDETLSTGVVIADFVQRGIVPLVLTATRGEAGELVQGVLDDEPGSPGFVAAREAELAGALAALGVEEHTFLGQPPARAADGVRRYRDSGMAWITPERAGPADADDERSLTSASLPDAAADVEAWVRTTRPDALVTYDDQGGYGHPDHVRMRELGTIVAGRLGVPLFEVREWSDEGELTVDRPDLLPVLIAALRHYATQLTVGGDAVTHVGGQRQPIVTRAGLRAIR